MLPSVKQHFYQGNYKITRYTHKSELQFWSSRNLQWMSVNGCILWKSRFVERLFSFRINWVPSIDGSKSFWYRRELTSGWPLLALIQTIPSPHYTFQLAKNKLQYCNHIVLWNDTNFRRTKLTKRDEFCHNIF